MGFDEAMLAVVQEPASGASAPAAPLLLSVDEAAQRLGVGLALMRSLVSCGEVESVKIGRLRRVPDDALGTYVQHLRDRSAQQRSKAG